MGLSDLRPKQQIFVKEYIRTKNGTQSALKAYDTNDPQVAKVIASENLTKPHIKQTIDEILEAVEYNPIESIQRLRATAQASLDSKASRSDGLKADEMLLKLSGNLVEKKETRSLSVSVDNLEKHDLLKLKAKYDKMLKSS